MKKIDMSLLLLSCVGACLMGCGSDSGDYSKYVTLGDYKNLSVTKEVEQVTDESLEAYEQEQLEEYAEYESVDGPVEEGQMVDVSLLAKDGNEVVYDFTDDDGYELQIGDAEFGDEVDDALIGASPEDEIDLEVTYDADFSDALLCGKTITYQIVVNSISSVTYPELTDEFAKENLGFDTVEKWENSLLEELQQTNEEDAEETLRQDLVKEAVAACTIDGYPKSLYKQKKEETISSYESYADMFGCSLDELYETLEIDEEAREQEYIDAVNETMVLSEIRRQEGLTLSEEQLQEKMEAYAQDYDYDSVEDLLADYDEDSLTEYFLNEATIDFLESNATITEK